MKLVTIVTFITSDDSLQQVRFELEHENNRFSRILANWVKNLSLRFDDHKRQHQQSSLKSKSRYGAVLYHTTKREFLNPILQNGHIPAGTQKLGVSALLDAYSGDGVGFVCLTDKFESAQFYAMILSRLDKSRHEPGIILELDGGYLRNEYLVQRPSPNFRFPISSPWYHYVKKLLKAVEYNYTAKIDPKAIFLFHYYDKIKSRWIRTKPHPIRI